MPNPKLYRALRSVGILPEWMEKDPEFIASCPDVK